ncbi:hypothetical protein [Serratia sp. (in: enterobacteria)]|uniref:hypothetical protein n=1 Tax=Serratia sp. (in: enterobacteria) TaxID=616 RepID=UPI003989EBA0
MKKDLEKIRAGFERMDKSNLPVTFRNFSRGSCGDTCEVLAELLKELGYGCFLYVAGQRDNGYSHAWLEQDGLVIDITADQFDEVSVPVYMGPINSWYQDFAVQQKHEAGYNRLDVRSKARLSGVHLRIKVELNT